MKQKRAAAIIIAITYCFSACFCDLFFANSVYAQQSSAGTENLNLGIKNYEKGKYEYAIINLNMALTQISEYNKEDLWKTHFYLGLSYYLIGDSKESRRELKKAKEILANKTLDPDIFSPRIVDLFAQVKVDKKTEIKVAVSDPAPPPSICKKNERGKKPFYCKWWFWTIATAVVGGGIAAASGGGGGDNDTVIVTW